VPEREGNHRFLSSWHLRHEKTRKRFQHSTTLLTFNIFETSSHHSHELRHFYNPPTNAQGPEQR
jgi:hypothetical protein